MFCHVKWFAYGHHQKSSKFDRSNISSEKAQNHRINKIFEFPQENLDVEDLLYGHLIAFKVV